MSRSSVAEAHSTTASPPWGEEPSTVIPIQIRRLRHQRYFAIIALGWTLAVAASLTWNLLDRAQAVRGLAAQVARTLFEKDLLFREWATYHGGVYVPVSERTQPNPYLNVPERDITTPSGKRLTLMNPAFMTRQVFELQDQKMGIRGHITSLNPLRPENQPDPWERQALEAFTRGAKEALSFVDTSQGKEIRLMRPIVTEQGCLLCHARQGYRGVGDIRGGISVTGSMAPFMVNKRNRNLVLAHVGLWLLGCAGLLAGGLRVAQQLREQRRMQAERESLIHELQGALAEVQTLSGLVPICSACKKIRDDQGFWHQVEKYVSEHSQATFTHGICPDCAKTYFPKQGEQDR